MGNNPPPKKKHHFLESKLTQVRSSNTFRTAGGVGLFGRAGLTFQKWPSFHQETVFLSNHHPEIRPTPGFGDWPGDLKRKDSSQQQLPQNAGNNWKQYFLGFVDVWSSVWRTDVWMLLYKLFEHFWKGDSSMWICDIHTLLFAARPFRFILQHLDDTISIVSWNGAVLKFKLITSTMAYYIYIERLSM